MSVLTLLFDVVCPAEFKGLTHCGVLLLQTRGVQRWQTCQNGTSHASPRRRQAPRALERATAFQTRQQPPKRWTCAALQRSSAQRTATRAPKLSRMVRWRQIGGARGILSHEARRQGMLRHERLLRRIVCGFSLPRAYEPALLKTCTGMPYGMNLRRFRLGVGAPPDLVLCFDF